MNCVLNVLFLNVSVTCTMRWSFLYHVVRKRWNMKPIFVKFAICVWKVANLFYRCRSNCSTIVAQYFGNDPAHLEMLRVPHAADHVLPLFAERVGRLILFQIGFQHFTIWMRFNLMNQLFGLLPCGCHVVVGQLNLAIIGVDVDATSLTVLSTGFSPYSLIRWLTDALA